MSTRYGRGIMVALALLAGALGAHAQTTNTWQGGTTAWATPGNWSEGVVPGDTHDVVIDGGGTAQPTLDLNVSGPAVTIKSLTIGETTVSTLTFHNGNVTDKKLIVMGNVTIGANGKLTHGDNSSAETHRLFLDIGGNLTIASGGLIDVQGLGYDSSQGPPGAASAGGGTHGGKDLWGYGTTYGNYLAPINLGAGGPSAGGAGGGAIKLIVSGATTNDGIIRADGQVAGARGAAGGSVFLTTGALAGSGTISAKGGYHTTASDYAGGGGRVAVVLTVSGADFTDFPTTNIVAWGGKRSAATTGGAAGTVYVQTGDENAGEGTLIVDNGNQASGWDHDTIYYHTSTAIPAGQTWTAHNLIVRGRGCLAVESGTTLDVRSSPTGDGINSSIALNGGTFRIPSELTIAGWALAVNGAHSVTGNVAVGGTEGSGWINHWRNSKTTTATYLMNLSVDGNLTINTNGAIDVVAMGFRQLQGPGAASSSGAGHGGRGWSWSSTRGRTYGDPVAPTNLGSGGHDGPSGGAIRLTVTGATTVNGPIDASGPLAGTPLAGNGGWMGSGGSVFLTTGTLSGTNAIRAIGGTRASGTPSSGGGRIAIVLTNELADFSAFTGPVQAFGGANATIVGAAGSVYLQTQAQGAGNGTFIVDNNGRAPNNADDITALDDISARTTTVGQVIIRNQGRFHVGADDNLIVQGDWTNAATFSAATGGKVTFAGPDTAALYGNTTFSELECVIAGKTLKFEVGKTFTVTNGLRFTGADGNLLRLESTDPLTQWNLAAQAGSVQRDVSYVAVSNSHAGTGEQIVAQNSTDLGGNVNWNFSNPEPITWTGGSNTAWNVGANWDLGRVPITADPRITIGASSHDPALNASYEYGGDLVVDADAVLSLNGFNLTMNGAITNEGTIAVSGSEMLAAGGDIDFSGGDFTAAQGTLRLAGTAAQTFRPDSNAFYTLDIGTTQAVTVANGFAARSVTFLSSSATVRFESGFATTNLRCIVSGGAALTYAATADFDIGDLTLRGADGVPIILRSTGDGSAWKLNVSGYAAVRYVDAKDSNANGGRRIVAIDSTDSTGNQNWDFGSGRLWTGSDNSQFHNVANWSPASVPGDTNHVVIDGSAATVPIVSVATTIGDLTVANLSGAPTLTIEAPFSSSGFLTVTGNVDIGTGATMTHTANNLSETYRIDLAIGGNMNVAAGGTINVTARGYANYAGPGGRSGGGGSHGGLGGYDGGQILTYGSATAPTNLGSGGDSGGLGGGAVRLDVTGATTVNGSIVAGGGTIGRGGAGGSVYLTTASLRGAGTIHANGGYHTTEGTAGWGGGGGGRVSVVLRQAGADFAPFTGVISARGGNQGTVSGAAGTVYRQTGDQLAGAGTVTIDNSGLVNDNVGVSTPIPAQQWPSELELEEASVTVAGKAVLQVSTNGAINALTVVTSNEQLSLGVAGDRLTVKALTIHGTEYTKGGSYTVANDWLGFGLPTNISGDGEVFLRVPSGTLFLFR